MIEHKYIDFRFIDINDIHEKKWNNWSRNYEWQQVIERIKILKPNSIHNTACGGMDSNDCLHLSFCRELTNIVPDTIHSDIWGDTNIDEYTPKNKPDGDNYIYYDIYTKNVNKFDMVICISVLEHLKNNIEEVLMNLFDQLNNGGTLILTFDYPIIDLNIIENLVNTKCKKCNNPLYNPNLGLYIVYIELRK